MSPVNLTLPAIREGVHRPVGRCAAVAAEDDDAEETEGAPADANDADANDADGDDAMDVARAWESEAPSWSQVCDQDHGAEYAENRGFAARFGWSRSQLSSPHSAPVAHGCHRPTGCERVQPKLIQSTP